MTTTAYATPDEPQPLAAGYQLAEREWARALGAYQGDGAATIYQRDHDRNALCICGASKRYCPGHDPADLVPYEQRVGEAMQPVPVCIQTSGARIRHDGTAETGRTIYQRAHPDWDTRTGREEWPPVGTLAPIESDMLDRRWRAQRDAEDDAREAAWHGDPDSHYEWDHR